MAYFLKLGSKGRLLLVLVVMVSLMSLSGILVVRSLHKLAELTQSLYEHPMTVTNAIFRVDGNIVRMHRSMKDAALATSPDQLLAAATAVDSYERKVQADMQIVRQYFLGPRAMVDDIDSAVAQWRPVRERVLAAMKAGDVQGAGNITKSEGAQKVAEISGRIEILSQWANQKAGDFATNAVQIRDQNVRLVVAVMLLSTVFLSVSLLLALRSILADIKNVQVAVDGLNSGEADLRYRLPHLGGDFAPLGAAINQFMARLEALIGAIKQRSETIAKASSEIANGNHDLSSRTEQQAVFLEETASSMEELTATIQQNGCHADKANQLAISASAIAVRGRSVVVDVVGTMSKIKASSNRIVDIIGVIEGIAFQTNILALNAAVEAA